MRRGFTIVELAVSGGVVLVGLCLLRVAAAQDRGAASQAANLANLGLTVRDFLTYAHDRDGDMPNLGLPTDPSADWYYTQGRVGVNTVAEKAVLYPANNCQWNLALKRHFGEERAYWHSTDGPSMPVLRRPLPPGAEMVGPFPTRFLYSLTMCSSPNMWTWPGRFGVSWDALQPDFEIVKHERIAYPSRKGVLLYDADQKQTNWLVAFADGAVNPRAVVDGNPAAQPAFHIVAARGKPVLSTVSGYLGWDY